MNITFLSPHDRISGGVKVIFKLAHYLSTWTDYKVKICLNRFTGDHKYWMEPQLTADVKLFESSNPRYYDILNSSDYVVMYGDGDNFIPLEPSVKRVLYLQHFGVHQDMTEKINLLYKYNGIITTTKWLANIAYGANTNNIFTVPPAVDDIFHRCTGPTLQSGMVNIGTLYHPQAWKNSVMAVLATSVAERTYTKYPLRQILLSGKSIPPETLKEFPVHSSVYVNPAQKELPRIYSSCNAWVSPSLSEGLGLTTLEAMACFCPVVWVNSLGLQEFLKGGTNCIESAPAKQDLASGICKILNDDNVRSSIMKRGKATASKFTWKATVKDFVKALQGIT